MIRSFFVSDRAVERNVKLSYFTIFVGVTTEILYLTLAESKNGHYKIHEIRTVNFFNYR